MLVVGDKWLLTASLLYRNGALIIERSFLDVCFLIHQLASDLILLLGPFIERFALKTKQHLDDAAKGSDVLPRLGTALLASSLFHLLINTRLQY